MLTSKVLNTTADYLSRLKDLSDWSIPPQRIIDQLEYTLGEKFEVDRFADNHNFKCNEFNSRCIDVSMGASAGIWML
jgi:hypothetical protein